MAALTLRSVKGTPLTNSELDANFTSLNTELGQKLVASSNLSDLANAATARTNLGLGNVENKSSATIRSELTSSNVTTALGFTPLAPAAIGTTVQAYDADLASIAGLAGTSGLLRKTAADTWSLDTNTYLTGNQSITLSGDASGSGATSISVTLANSGVTAGTYTKVTVDAKGRVTTGASLASSDVTTALGFTPYNSTNPSGFITSAALSSYLPLSGGTLAGGLQVGYGGGDLTIRATAANDLGDLVWANYSGTEIHRLWDGGDGLNYRYNGGTGYKLLHAGNYTSYSPNLTGSGASGTWGINITGNAGTVGGLSTSQLFNNMGNGHNTYTDFNNVPNFGAYYVQQGGNSPTGVTSHQWYGFTLGLGNDYPLSQYATQLYWPRAAQNSDTYIYVRDREGGSWGGWRKIRAGYADSAGSATDNTKLPLSGGTLSGTLRFGDSTNGLYLSSGRLTVRSESNDNVANFASYGLYLPVLSQTAGLYVESPIEARTGLRMGSGAANGTITVGADTGVVGNRIVQRDANGYIYANHINFNTGESENPNISSFITSNGDGWSRKSSLAHVKNQIRGVADGTWDINVTGTSGSTTVLKGVGYGADSFTWHQAAGSFAGNNGWASYLISNHGAGATYYNQTIIMPFWSAPQYSRLEGGTFRGPYTFLSTENYTSYSPTLTGGGASGTWGISVTGSSNSLNLSGHTISSNSWAGGGGYHGYTFSGGNWRFGFSSSTGVIDVYADGNFYATDSSHLVLHAGNYSSYALPLSGGTVEGTANVRTSVVKQYLYVRHIEGKNWDTYDTGASGLYLNYASNQPVYIGSSAHTVWHAGNAGRAGNSDLMYYQSFPLDANTMASNATGFTYAVNAPHTGPVARFSTGGGYDLWLNAPYSGGGNALSFRTRNGDNATLNPWRAILHDGNFSSYAVPSRSRSNWNDGTVINNVVGQLAWKNYSNSHTIFDASNSTTPNGTSCSNTNPDYAWSGTYPTLMGWNGGNTYGVRVDSSRYSDRANRANGNFYIDDNYGCGIVGVYSSVRYQGVFAMGDAYKLPADGTGLGTLYGMAWSHPNAGGAAGNLTDHGLLIINNGSFRCAISNSIVASSNITAYSDERLKKNWRPMPENFVARLAQVKVGIYDRTDEEDVTQVGVSAQSFQALLPQAIMTAKDEIGTLSVSYGNAALASAVELAKDNVELRARIERLESLIATLIGDQK